MRLVFQLSMGGGSADREASKSGLSSSEQAHGTGVRRWWFEPVDRSTLVRRVHRQYQMHLMVGLRSWIATHGLRAGVDWAHYY